MRRTILIYLTLVTLLHLCFATGAGKVSRKPYHTNVITCHKEGIHKIEIQQQQRHKVRTKVIQSGLFGALAGAGQVIILMWLRTISTYQYRHGVSMHQAITELYADGGVLRFYRGWPFAIFQGPLSKFGSIAANELAIILCKSGNGNVDTNSSKYKIKSHSLVSNVMLSSLVGGILSTLWRLLLMPIDVCKTVLQINGERGLTALFTQVRQGKIHLLYQGTAATLIGTLIAHYPWFLVYNLLDRVVIPVSVVSGSSSSTFTFTTKPAHNINHTYSQSQSHSHNNKHTSNIPAVKPNQQSSKSTYRYSILRSSCIGFIATVAADCVSNMFRVIKTIKQTGFDSKEFHHMTTAAVAAGGGGGGNNNKHYLASTTVPATSDTGHTTGSESEPIVWTYFQIVARVYSQQGMTGLMGRGLLPKIISDGIQGLFFTVVWKLLLKYQDEHEEHS